RAEAARPRRRTRRRRGGRRAGRPGREGRRMRRRRRRGGGPGGGAGGGAGALRRRGDAAEGAAGVRPARRAGPAARARAGRCGVRIGALDRAIRRASAAAREEADRCGLCDAPAPDEHVHVLDETGGELLCTCRACGLLFEREGAGFGHYRLVPRRRRRLRGVPAADLGVPVGLAFLTLGPDGAVVARCPSPAGVTAWTVGRDAWAAVAARS